MWDRHGVTPEEALEAISDPDVLVRSPDPSSKSGLSDRFVGWSATSGKVLVVIVVRYDGALYGANAWPANGAYRALYERRLENE